MQPKRSHIRCLDSKVRDHIRLFSFSRFCIVPCIFMQVNIVPFMFLQTHLLPSSLHKGTLFCYNLPRSADPWSLPVHMILQASRMIDPILTMNTHFPVKFPAAIPFLSFRSELLPWALVPSLNTQILSFAVVLVASSLFLLVLAAVNRSAGFIRKPDESSRMDFSILDLPDFWTSITEFSKDLILPDTLSALRILLITCEEQDQYTLGHSIRVLAISKCISDTMGLPAQTRKEIAAAALLHDIGKIDIPPAILQKKGKLTEKEMISIRNHPRYSVDILRRYNILKELYPSIQHHHEWYSGHGYPDRIRGDEIPLGARIINVADAVDAMLSIRPYQKAKTVNQTIRELERLKGLQFDPAIAEQAISLLEKSELIERIYYQEHL